MSTVLITGAKRGLGLEFARQYAADGWEVISTSRNPEKCEQLQQLQKKNNKVSLQALDVTSGKSVEALARAVGGRAIDLLILNSAIYARKGTRIGEIDFDAWREAIETNLMAAISTGMGSMQALQSTIGFGAAYQYRTSKAALNMAMSILAKEMEPRGISVVIFDPGWVQTDMGGANAALKPQESIGGM